MNETQQHRLAETLRYARERSPFYRSFFAALPPDVRELGAVPILEHETFWRANDPHESRVLTGPFTDGIVFKSGGTTGEPKYSFFSNADWQAFTAAFGGGMRRGGIREGERIANIFYGGQLYASFLFISRSIEQGGAGVCYPISGGAPLEEQLYALRAFDIRTLAGVPTSIMKLVEAASSIGEHGIQLEHVLYGGESMFDDQIAELQRVFPGCQVRSVGIAGVDYGELGWVDASTCGRGEHRTFDESTIVEIVEEESGTPIEEQGVEGRILVTNLSRRLMPIIRYPVGDRGMWLEPAGVPARKFRLLGRASEGARVGPMTLYVSDMARLVGDLPQELHASAFQIVVDHFERRDRCVLRIAVAAPARVPPHMAEQLRARLYAERSMFRDLDERGIVHPLAVEWTSLAQLETNPRTGKLKRVIDRRLSSGRSQ